jgi:hypothetical protein
VEVVARFDLFVVGYVASAYLPAGNLAKTGFLTLLAVMSWAGFGRRKSDLAIALAGVATSWPLEIVLTHAGTFQHLHPDFLGVPLWLGPLYALGTLSTGTLARWALRPAGGRHTTASGVLDPAAERT